MSWSSHILLWLLSEAQFQSTEAKWAQSKYEILWQWEGGLQPQRALLMWKWCVGKEAASALGHIFTQRGKITSVLHHPAACHNHKGLFTHWSDSEGGGSWAAMAKHKLPGQSHATGSLTKPPPVFTSGEGGVKFLATSKEIKKSFSTQLWFHNFSHTLSREDLRKSRDSMTHLFLSAQFSFLFHLNRARWTIKMRPFRALGIGRTPAQFCGVENVFNHF